MKRALSIIAGLLIGVAASALSNDFFNASGVPSTGAALVSSTIRGEFSNIGVGFDKMPTLAGNGNKVVTVNAGGTALTATAATALSGMAIGANVQAWDADLDAIAALGTTGLPARTAANTWSLRTLTGTANEITVTNGDGVAGNPTISLPSTLTLTSRTVTADTQAVGDSSTKVATTAFVQATIPSGTILDFAGTAAPSGYALCDGSSLLRASFPALFAAIGTTWGAADGTHFNVPNFQRRVTVGSGGAGTGTLANSVGSTGGEETHTMSTGEMVAHTHTQQGTFGSGGQSANHTHNTSFATGNDPVSQTGNDIAGSANAIFGSATATSSGFSADHSHNTTISGATTSTGSSTAFNQLQPSAVVLKIIKL